MQVNPQFYFICYFKFNYKSEMSAARQPRPRAEVSRPNEDKTKEMTFVVISHRNHIGYFTWMI